MLNDDYLKMQSNMSPIFPCETHSKRWLFSSFLFLPISTLKIDRIIVKKSPGKSFQGKTRKTNIWLQGVF